MPRRPRYEGADALHHVVVRAPTDMRMVDDDVDCAQFLDEFRIASQGCEWECLAYCVLSTHAHFVLQTPEPNLADGMRRLQGRYARAYNRRHQRQGHLFGRRYWSRRIDKPHYLRCASLYAVLNPVEAGICRH